MVELAQSLNPFDDKLRQLEAEEAKKLQPFQERLRLLEATEGQEGQALPPGQKPAKDSLGNATDLATEIADEEEKKRKEAGESESPHKVTIAEELLESASNAMIIDRFSKMSPEGKRLTLEIVGTFIPIPGLQEVAGASLLARIIFRVTNLLARSGAPGAAGGSAISETFDPSDNLEEALTKVGIAGGTAVTGQKVGEVITKGGGKLFRPAVDALEQGARTAIKALAETGDILTPGKAGKSFFVDLIESVADMAIFGGEILGKTRESATAAAESTVRTFFQTFQKHASKTEVGTLLQNTITNGKTGFQ